MVFLLIFLIQTVMNIEIQNRLRDQKKKIFAEQISKNKSTTNLVASSSLARLFSPGVDAQPAQQIEDVRLRVDELKVKNTQLKLLLKQERERYDSLFEEYEELQEKISLIEKEYINLKYEHNKEMKEWKKTVGEKIGEEVERIVGEMYGALKDQSLGDIVIVKIQKMVEQLRGLSQSVASSRLSKKFSKKTLDIGQEKERLRLSRSVISEEGVQQKDQVIQSVEMLRLIQRQSSPVKQQDEIILSAQQMPLSQKQLFFQDEYYGELEDFNQFQQKVTMRRNYQLLRRNRVNNDVKRKKIFNSSEVKC